MGLEQWRSQEVEVGDKIAKSPLFPSPLTDNGSGGARTL